MPRQDLVWRTHRGHHYHCYRCCCGHCCSCCCSCCPGSEAGEHRGNQISRTRWRQASDRNPGNNLSMQSYIVPSSRGKKLLEISISPALSRGENLMPASAICFFLQRVTSVNWSLARSRIAPSTINTEEEGSPTALNLLGSVPAHARSTKNCFR